MISGKKEIKKYTNKQKMFNDMRIIDGHDHYKHLLLPSLVSF